MKKARLVPLPDSTVIRQRLDDHVGELTETSFFMATYSMYFPFLNS
jgi:hypothetical protein